ncbi:MAG: NUDIX hydrolase [Thermoplasmatota archaeon]
MGDRLENYLPLRPWTLVRFVYAESDGMLFLIPRGERLSLPREDEVPFSYDVTHSFHFRDLDAEVVFAVPHMDHHPTEWTHKDDAAWRDDVDALVRRAVNATLIREVVGALIRSPQRPDHILMVQASRGFTKGTWNMPGGFVQYGETPEEATLREVMEEVGLKISDLRLLCVSTRRFSGPYFMRAHVFEARASSEEVKLEPTEIETSTWMRIAEARALTLNPFTKEGIDALEPDEAQRVPTGGP